MVEVSEDNKRYILWKDWANEAGQFGSFSYGDASYFKGQLTKMKAFPSSGVRILEIGFGNGSFLGYSRSMGWTITGIETNKTLVNLASELNFEAYHGSSLEVFQDNSFDLIVAFDVLEHLPEAGITQMMLDIKRIATNGAIFIARFPNGDSPFGLPYQNGDITHLSSIGTGKVNYYIKQLGAKLLYVGGEFVPIKGFGLVNFIHKTVSLPIIWAMNLLTKLIFFPKSKINFFAKNLVLAIKIIK